MQATRFEEPLKLVNKMKSDCRLCAVLRLKLCKLMVSIYRLVITAFTLIGEEEGIKGYWKGNLPHIIPYSGAQLFADETCKKLFRGSDGDLSVIGRLAAGACAGMTSTFVTHPLDVL
ncbi:unnamed protein product [Fraxinus pennsylvanica]|uniref:Uncharacterized protein n=1 Tax=Fraxinus pennsylvanica TaxID=56036 RepID=A0AAD2A7B9_9LAMI|nr:unnamed protein product [Fraxinus pennsylvanica]